MKRIRKSSTYIPGTSRLTPKIGKERKLQFDLGEIVEVTEEEFEIINARNWCVEEV